MCQQDVCAPSASCLGGSPRAPLTQHSRGPGPQTLGRDRRFLLEGICYRRTGNRNGGDSDLREKNRMGLLDMTNTASETKNLPYEAHSR